MCRRGSLKNNKIQYTTVDVNYIWWHSSFGLLSVYEEIFVLLCAKNYNKQRGYNHEQSWYFLSPLEQNRVHESNRRGNRSSKVWEKLEVDTRERKGAYVLKIKNKLGTRPWAFSLFEGFRPLPKDQQVETKMLKD